MDGQFLFTVHPGKAILGEPIELVDAGLREREDLQEWVRKHPQVLGPNIRIVTFEFSEWRSREGSELDRLDLLGIDSDGRLVVAELKRGTAPSTVEMQAIKYAAFASRFTEETLSETHAKYLSNEKSAPVSLDEARSALENHIDGEFDPDLLRQPRIVLMAARFPPQVTATAVWLTEMGLDISLVQFGAYRAEHDIVLTVSQLWPPQDIEDFTVSPRQASIRAADARSHRRRETTAVDRLIADGVLDDGAPLHLDCTSLPTSVRDGVEHWLLQDEKRGRVTWQNDSSGPLVWEIDEQGWTPTGLAREMIERATDEPPPVVRGPRLWITDDGQTLSRLAGFGARGARDWSILHEALKALKQGDWTTYSDLAAVVGSAPVPVGRHVATCTDCVAAYRVLTAAGRIASQFAWADPNRKDDPQSVLEAEGVHFTTDGVASPVQRVNATELSHRIESGTLAAATSGSRDD